ncbi:hypothetical protein FNU79_06955 [Deinococcus detaillensis]|uniref:Uncharacterized protein n=1 Tax=Deinococcus detaillensis TaxID=2592048 RepID=A0A553V1P3_9DEIO|nr:hypothetical protein [Deinococcus detaillensis]TSA86393.1 hypothetical protein FNU79_06955 [Deinococcus detaillensis]
MAKVHSAQLDLSWRSLEARLPLDELPTFHRAFLSWRGVEGAAEMPLRRVQQRVEAELNKWVQSGEASREGDDLLISRAALSGFSAAEHWLIPLPD